MTDTPNARLARVLRLLADVAERGTEGGLMAARAMYFALNDDLDTADVCATESARLAGVPLDGWYTSEPPKGVTCLLTRKNGVLYVGTFDGSSWSVENFLDLWPSDILAWRPLVEPYRTAEVKP